MRRFRTFTPSAPETRGVNPKLPLGALVGALYAHWTVGDWGSVAKFSAPSPRGAAAPAGTLIAPLTGQKKDRALKPGMTRDELAAALGVGTPNSHVKASAGLVTRFKHL